MKWFLSTAVLLVILGLYLDSLVPKEVIEHRPQVVACNAVFLLFNGFMYMLEEYGGYSFVEAMEQFPIPDPTYNNSHVKSYDDVIVGVPVRVYTPDSKSVDSPMILYFHGGGFAFGNPDSHHPTVMDLTNRTNAVIISVDYRLAPKHPFPAGHDDCIAVTRFVMGNLKKYGVTSGRVFTAGDSAGGNLATVVNGELVKEKLILSGAIMIYPTTQMASTGLSSHGSKSFMLLSIELMSKFLVNLFGVPYRDNYRTVVQNRYICRDKQSEEIFSKYLPGVELSDDCDPTLYKNMKQVFEPKASPLFRPSLKDLAPTLVLVAEIDLLHDEAILYYDRLQLEGVESKLKIYEGAFHGFFSFIGEGVIPSQYTAIMSEIVHFVDKH